MFVPQATPLLRRLLMLVALTVGVGEMWGEDTHPYAGVWYLTNSYNKTTSYYVVPAANPQITTANHVNEDAYFSSNYSQEAGDPEKPFLTTYMTNGDLNSIWILVPVTGENYYYYIVHAKTGKYLKFQTYLTGNNARRKFVHLETIATPGDTEKFEIQSLTVSGKTGVKIKPKNHTYYFNIAGENRDRYNGYESGVEDPYYSGIIGGMNGTDGGSLFTLSDASSATTLPPVISDVNGATTTFTITSPAAAFSTIRYTTDGTTTPNASTGTTATSGAAINITNKWIVQAVGVFGTLTTPVAGPKSLTPIVTPVISYNNTTSTASITCATPGVTIYYTTDGTSPTTSSTKIKYTAPFPLTSATTVRAIATRTDFPDSEEATSLISKAAAPVTEVTSDGKVKLVCSTIGVSIYYEIGEEGSVADPTTSSARYTTPLSNVSGKVVKAIAVKKGWINSDIGGSSSPIVMQCAKPTIRRGTGNTFTITCSFPAEGCSIYYTTGNGDPTTLYNGPVTIESYPITIKAIAKANGYNNSLVAEKTITENLSQEDGFYLIASAGDFEKFVTMANTSDGAGYNYKLDDDFTVGNTTAITQAFTGTFDGNFHTITSLSKALFNTINGGTVKNVRLKPATVSGSTNAGAICNEASGSTKIYNCGVLSGEISGSTNDGNVGGIVGFLDGNARVINCFSYADITNGSSCGGIVGYNNVETKSSNIAENSGTMVMNCMFYGDITGDNPAPIYGGEIIHNKYSSATDTGLNNYCYFLYDEDKNPYVKTIADDNYHGALGAEGRYLNRFEFFRMTLNSTRSMAAYYITGNAADKSIMAKWVLDKSIADYPILKPQDYYPSIVNLDAEHAIDIDGDNEHRNEGRSLGTLTVKIRGVGGGAQFDAPSGAYLVDENGNTVTSRELTLNITDKDYANFNFNYKKIQLPYYSEVGKGNYTDYLVVTGWKIVSVDHAGTGSFTHSTSDFPDWNFVDRTCTDKDLYSISGRVFNQGGFYEVPDGVTEITIEPYWAKAVYLSDANYDITYSGTNKYGVTVGGNFSTPTALGTQTVYNVMATAITNLGINSEHTVYDYAVVLVGNYHHYTNNAPANDTNPFTIMSADLDGDLEPDNTLFYYHNGRKSVSPIRFDFLNMPGIGMVKRTHDATTDPEPGIFKPNGWFEITNTVFVRFGQFEYSEVGDGTGYTGKLIDAPVILQGGIYEQFVSSRSTASGKTNYLFVGGNAWFKNFANGCHTSSFLQTPKIPINVAGGDYENFYLTGIYQPNGDPTDENAECYIDGGRFGEVAGAGMQRVDGSVTWLINGADITNFFGGGINPAQSITGNVSTTISNSYVTEFYGGPKFGEMTSGKTVTTTATDCHFGEFYGAGYGGTAFNKVIPSTTYDSSTTGNTRDWGSWVTAQYKREYSSGNKGISTSYDYEFMLHSDGNQTVARFYVNYASLSLASTREVISNLNGCEIGVFFGGGRLGAVNGDIRSTLTDCHVTGNAYGGGYSAEVPTVEVWKIVNMKPAPSYNRKANVFNNASVKFPNEQTPKESVVYTWSDTHSSTFTDIPDDPSTTDINEEAHYIHTDVGLSGLGAVNGDVFITLNGSTHIDGNVFGGGDASPVNGSATVNITQ
jgi:hypothetical protein